MPIQLIPPEYFLVEIFLVIVPSLLGVKTLLVFLLLHFMDGEAGKSKVPLVCICFPFWSGKVANWVFRVSIGFTFVFERKYLVNKTKDLLITGG